jgi:hypothetical protein
MEIENRAGPGDGLDPFCFWNPGGWGSRIYEGVAIVCVQGKRGEKKE